VKYKFRTKPYKHQREGIRFAFRQFEQGLGAAFLFEPRTGKTKTTIDTISALYVKHGVRKVFIIAPNRVLGVWVQEFHAHCPLVHQVIVWDARERRKGTIPQPAGHIDLQIVVTNFETFGTPGKKTPSGRRSRTTGRFKNRSIVEKWLGTDDAVGVIDEGHKIKSPSGKASNMIVGMRRLFPYRLLLTGTPITKAHRAADIYMQWQWVNPHRFTEWGPTYQAFRDHLGVWTTREGGIPIFRREKPRGMRDLRRGLHKDGMVVHRADCFDLPATMPDRIVPIKLTTSAKPYDDMAREMVAELESGEIAEASIPLVVTLRLSQITSGFVGIMEPHPTNPDKMFSRPVRVGKEKVVALQTILSEEVVEQEEKVIIVAKWKADLNAIERLCKRLGIVSWSIRGGMTRSDTDDALRRFKQHSDGPAAMVVQPQAGGVGIDMSTAGHTIWFSLTPSWVDYTQMRDRNALSTRGVQHTFLIAQGTIDELLYSALQTDGNVSKAILKKPKALLRSS
jgi:SNF2 family DNA or RNA helicase